MQHHDFPVCLFGSVSVEECKPACIVKCHVLIHVYQLWTLSYNGDSEGQFPGQDVNLD